MGIWSVAHLPLLFLPASPTALLLSLCVCPAKNMSAIYALSILKHCRIIRICCWHTMGDVGMTVGSFAAPQNEKLMPGNEVDVGWIDWGMCGIWIERIFFLLYLLWTRLVRSDLEQTKNGTLYACVVVSKVSCSSMVLSAWEFKQSLEDQTFASRIPRYEFQCFSWSQLLVTYIRYYSQLAWEKNTMSVCLSWFLQQWDRMSYCWNPSFRNWDLRIKLLHNHWTSTRVQ